MKKERIFYLDFVRAIATIAILLTHYNALYVYMADESVMDAYNEQGGAYIQSGQLIYW